MGDFLYGGSVLANDSCVSSQSLLDTLSLNNLLNIKHLTNGSNVAGGGGLSPSVASEPSAASPNSSSLVVVDSCVDNNNSSQKLGKKSDEQGLLITSGTTGPMAATSNSSIPTSSEIAASVVNTLSSLQSDDDTSTSSLLNGGGGGIASPIASLNNNNNPNAANNNLLIENSDLHMSNAVEELSLKGADLSCLGVTTSSHMVLPPNGGLNFGATSDHNSSPWSTSIDEATSSHLSINGLGAFQNFSSNHLYNGAAVAAAAAAAAVQQQRRAITASHGGGFPGHHTLSPNATNPNHMLQQHQNTASQPNQNHFKNSYPTWSNPAPSGPWSQQQQQHSQQQQQPNPMNSWNRGRSVPNNMNLGNGLTNPLHPGGRKPPHNSQQPSQAMSPYANHGIHHQQQQQQQQQQHLQLGSAGSNLINSPSKYRRSTSYPGKSGLGVGGGGGGVGNNGGFGGGPLDVVQLDDARDPFLSAYQDRTGLNNGLDMRSLEHCLSDIMRNVGEASQPDHLKGFLNCNTNTLQSLAQLHGKLDFHEFIPGKPFFSGLDEHITDDAGGFGTGKDYPNGFHSTGNCSRSSPHSNGSESTERFSRKVFVGGLPPDIDEEEITTSFNQYGALVVDWPHKAESKSYFPPKGYAFLLFQEERGVQKLIETCHPEDDKLYITVSSPTIKNKAVQIRPWRLADADYVLDASMPLDPRKTVFVGGVPRPLKAYELATIMDRLYGGVCYAGIDTDPELKYPKGAGRVAFSNQQSYIAAISARFVQLQHGDIDKRVEVKPYVLDDQMCDECQGQRCGGKFAPFFCANVTCLQYYCEHCWAHIHSRSGREYHKPLVKEGADRPRAVPFRWC